MRQTYYIRHLFFGAVYFVGLSNTELDLMNTCFSVHLARFIEVLFQEIM